MIYPLGIDSAKRRQIMFIFSSCLVMSTAFNFMVTVIYYLSEV